MPDLLIMVRVAWLLIGLSASAFAQRAVQIDPQSDRLVYTANERGDRVPDFSSCGYLAGQSPVPDVPPKIFVTAAAGDATHRIQQALDYVGNLPVGPDGFRGAVLLSPGTHKVQGQLRMDQSGVVLRGSGANKTIVLATGTSRRPLVRICPQSPKLPEVMDEVAIAQPYVPVGAIELAVESPHSFVAGQRVQVKRPGSEAWIKQLGAKALGVGWRPERVDTCWERTLVEVSDNQLRFDAPITCAMDQQFETLGTVAVVRTHRLRKVGVQDLTLRSHYPEDRPLDEDHAWHGVVANHVEDAWVQRVRFQHFAGGAVLLREHSRRVSVLDCLCLAPVSELAGYRRHSFYTAGQQTLFLRCWAEQGMHDFSVGHCAQGPNAFVHCYAHDALSDSGPLEAWATGVLYDNVRIDGANLFLGNRWLDPKGAGWSAANCVAWQCQAAQLHCFDPPGAQNWALGFWAQPVGDGHLESESEYLRPISLFQQQTKDRLGAQAAKRVGPFLLNPVAATRPTLAQAEQFVADSSGPKRMLRDEIEARMQQADAPSVAEVIERKPALAEDGQHVPAHDLKVVNGWLTIDGKVLTGRTLSPTWWRGTILPREAVKFGPSITRYAPGRYGMGLTDELSEVSEWMQQVGAAAYDHHYGLWYDRRRDDHLMVRRATGEVCPPFYDQPFARSGVGKAWDGLSKYDLTMPNPWYWGRLSDFAQLCQQQGHVLLHQCYFQHNILEAGGHWADSPWRPANNINQSGLPEPPPYVGDKRIFLAHQFYGPENQRLRELHRGYLRQCVQAFQHGQNVIHMTSAEFTGPLEFTQFWVDQVHAVRKQLGSQSLIAISAPKNVQDTLLSDPAESDKIDLIDIRYWCYTDGQVYAPQGGVNLAPRQHLRQWKGTRGGFDQVVQAVREYRTRYPEKPVTFQAGRNCPTTQPGWAVLMGGGSLAEVPALPAELLQAIVAMRPVARDGELLRLQATSGERLCYAQQPGAGLKPIPSDQLWRVRWVNAQTGQVTGEVQWDGRQTLSMPEQLAWIAPK